MTVGWCEIQEDILKLNCVLKVLQMSWKSSDQLKLLAFALERESLTCMMLLVEEMEAALLMLCLGWWTYIQGRPTLLDSVEEPSVIDVAYSDS